jgi:hypothetical protein
MATQTATTVLTILQMISDARGETSTNTDAARIRAVSRAERDFAKRRFWRIHLLKDQTTTGDGSNSNFTIGSSSYPMRAKGLTEVFVGGTTEDKRYQVVDFSQFKLLYNGNNAAQIAYEWYDATNDLWKMKINPTPGNGDTITYSYFWEPPTRTSTSDTVVCYNMDILFRLALAYIYEGEDEDKYKEQLALAESLIDETTGMENSPAQGQLYVMGAIENISKNRGIGSY